MRTITLISKLIMRLAALLFMVLMMSGQAQADFCPGLNIEHKIINLNEVTVTVHNDQGKGFYQYDFPIDFEITEAQCPNLFVYGNSVGMRVQAGAIERTNSSFQTNNPGIGVKYYLHGNKNWSLNNNGADNLMPYTKYTPERGLANSSAYVKLEHTQLQLFTVGTFASGDIDAESFPHLLFFIMTQNSMSPVILKDLAFTGKIHIVNPSCTTPDYTYALGNHGATEFGGTGRVSKWVSAPVILTGCSVFHGNLRNGSVGSTISEVNPGVYTSSASIANMTNAVNMTLVPNTSWVDRSKGIIALENKPSSATGIGIQIGVKDSSSNYSVTDMNSPVTVNASLGSSGNVTFPLGARYIQTGPSFTGGTANASLTYTIDYQ